MIVLPAPTPAQTNSEKASQVSGRAPEPPISPKAEKDSIKAARLKAKKAKAARDSAKAAAAAPAPAPAAAPAPTAPSAPAPAATSGTSPAQPAAPATGAAPAPAPSAPAATAPADTLKAPPMVVDSAKDLVGTSADTAKPSVEAPALAAAPARRAPQDIRLFNDPPLIGREYGFGVLGSLVAGTLGFYIGSGIETAIVGESKAHKGTLAFKGIRYDNFKGAFWGGSTGMILGSALTTYFTGQIDEEDGGFFMTLLGTTAASAGAFYVASLMGVNDEVDWKPFIPLLAIPSVGGALGFNVSRWYHDRKREEVVGKEAAVRLHAPALALGFGQEGERVELSALRLTF
jgi:hypothetical protein